MNYLTFLSPSLDIFVKFMKKRTKEEAITLASEIAAQVTESTPDADLALFVPYVFIETTMAAVGGKLEIGAEVSRNSLSRLNNVAR